MAPLIDVVFLLLVFFMLTSTFLPPSLPLDLPTSGNTNPSPTEPIVVSMNAEGVVAINGEMVTEENFVETLRVELQTSGTEAVLFRGDRTAAYGSFLRWMDLAKQAGARKLNLVHQAE